MKNRQDLVPEQEGRAGSVSRPQLGAGGGVGVASLRGDMAGVWVLGGKMVGSVLDMELEMPMGHPGRGGLRGLLDRGWVARL